MNTSNLQQIQFLKSIQKKIHPRSLADELMALLSINKSSAYRRLTGESQLSFNETVLLLQTYSVSLETQLNPQTTRFHAPFLNNKPTSMTAYLDSIERNLSVLAQSPDSKIQYMAHEVPFFHYLFEPDLAAFKMYMWSRTVWRIESMRFEDFDLDKYRQDAALQKQMQRLSAMYASIESEEIWNSNMLDITLNQIRHCCQSNRFKTKQEATELFRILRGLIVRLQRNVEIGEKTNGQTGVNPHKLKAWYNELLPTATFILATIHAHQSLYLTFESPNFIQNDDEDMCQQSNTIFRNHKQIALNLTGDNEPNRGLFFERMTKKVDISAEELQEFLA